VLYCLNISQNLSLQEPGGRERPKLDQAEIWVKDYFILKETWKPDSEASGHVCFGVILCTE